MDPSFSKRLAYGLTLVIWVGFAVTLLRLELEPIDDLLLLQRSTEQSFTELLTKPYIMDAYPFYRPLIGLMTKTVYSFCNVCTPCYRVLQMAFVFLILIEFHLIARTSGTTSLGELTSVLYVLSSPFTLTALYWWADLTSVLCMNCFLAAVLYIHVGTEERSWGFVPALGLSIVALLSKETGLIVPFLLFAYLAVWKQFRLAVAVLIVVALYFALRLWVLGFLISGTPFFTNSGYLLSQYSAEELAIKFGSHPYWFYLYNVIAQALSLFTSQPQGGQFVFHSWRSIVLFGWYLISSALIIWYLCLARRPTDLYLLLGIGVNVVLSYQYCRGRNLAIAGVAYAILLGRGVAALESLFPAALQCPRVHSWPLGFYPDYGRPPPDATTPEKRKPFSTISFRTFLKAAPLVLFIGYSVFAAVMVVQWHNVGKAVVESYGPLDPPREDTSRLLYNTIRQRHYGPTLREDRRHYR